MDTANSAVGQVRLIYKVLILGNRPSLQAGFLNQASGSCLSYQLYTALGIGIGVARMPSPIGTVTLQLWLIPSQERFVGITRGLMKGARSSIVVVRDDDLANLSDLLLELAPEQKDSLSIVVVGSLLDRESVRFSVEDALRQECKIHRADSVQETLRAVSELMVLQLSERPQPIRVMLLDERYCPEFQFHFNPPTPPPNTREEIQAIRRFASSLGLEVSDSACMINLEEGVAQLELATGALVFRSRLCEECRKDCKKEERICIVGQDKGWSSEGMGPRALLTMAKLQALNGRRLPEDVRLQIDRAVACSRFTPKPGSDISRCSHDPRPSNQIVGRERTTLLEEAQKRVMQGRLPSSVYNMLKSKLQRAEEKFNRAEGADSPCRLE